MRLPPLPAWRLSGFSHPRMVNERNPQVFDHGVAGLYPAPRLAVGQMQARGRDATGGAVELQRWGFGPVKTNADNRFVGITVHCDLNEAAHPAAIGIGHREGYQVQPRSLEDVCWARFIAGCTVAEIPASPVAAGAGKLDGQRRPAFRDRSSDLRVGTQPLAGLIRRETIRHVRNRRGEE